MFYSPWLVALLVLMASPATHALWLPRLPASYPTNSSTTTTAGPSTTSCAYSTQQHSHGASRSSRCPTSTAYCTSTVHTTSSYVWWEPVWVTVTDCTSTGTGARTSTITDWTTITDYNLAYKTTTVWVITDTQYATSFVYKPCSTTRSTSSPTSSGVAVTKRGGPTVTCLPTTTTSTVTSTSTDYVIVTSTYTGYPIKTSCVLTATPTTTRTVTSTSWTYPTEWTTTVGTSTTITATSTVCSPTSTSTFDPFPPIPIETPHPIQTKGDAGDTSTM